MNNVIQFVLDALGAALNVLTAIGDAVWDSLTPKGRLVAVAISTGIIIVVVSSIAA